MLESNKSVGAQKSADISDAAVATSSTVATSVCAVDENKMLKTSRSSSELSSPAGSDLLQASPMEEARAVKMRRRNSLQGDLS